MYARRGPVLKCHMAHLTVWKQFMTAVDDHWIKGSWAIQDGVVKVRTPHGEKAMQIEGRDPLWLAARLACELAAEKEGTKENGPP
jgi:hypothetical protein